MNLLAQAFEAIASSSGTSKRKTGIELPGLENFTNHIRNSFCICIFCLLPESRRNNVKMMLRQKYVTSKSKTTQLGDQPP